MDNHKHQTWPDSTLLLHKPRQLNQQARQFSYCSHIACAFRMDTLFASNVPSDGN